MRSVLIKKHVSVSSWTKIWMILDEGNWDQWYWIQDERKAYNKIQIIIKEMNVEMYTQMGYSEAQVRRAHEYSQKNRIDMFDALQQLQNKEHSDNQKQLQRNVPTFSYLNNIKNIKLGDYQIVYNRSGIRENTYARDELREPNTPVGLFNVSNCCYLNSLLQCYFLMGAFTREILSAQEITELPDQSGNKLKRIKNQYMLLGALKQIFAKMKLSSRRYLDPTPVLRNLVNSVGEKIQFGDEKDLNEINMEIVERLSECLMYTKKYYSKEGSPSKIKKKENIKQLFYGEKVEFIEGIEEEIVVDFMGLILNPKHDDLLSALDAQLNYDVEIDGKIMKKHTFIRSLPHYLFFTISRTEFEKKGNQIVKNSQKLGFDFVIYLDQFLQVNREEGKLKNPKIKELQNKKNGIKFQLNHLDLLGQKLEECRTHAKYIGGWQQKFPKQEEVEQSKQQYKKQIEEIQKELAQVESRKQKYILMYLFVHRGDAISGHYWGYGRNGNQWYRFDVNCSSIKEVDIFVDIEKSGGIPYALLYAKDGQLQSFAYPYYIKLQASNNLLDIPEPTQDYKDYIPTRLKKQIIAQNIAMHESVQKQKLKSTIESVVKDYAAKYNIVKSETQKYVKGQKNGKIPSFANFACFLESKGEPQFMKYNIFSIALASKASITCNELLHDEKLLKALQNAFRKKMKGKMSLRHFAIECQPGQGAKYKQAGEEYVIGKKCIEFIRLVNQGMKEWPNMNNINGVLQDMYQVLRQEQDGIYVKSVARQIMAIILLDLGWRKQPLKHIWANACDKQNPLLKQQLGVLQARQLGEQIQIKASSISQIQIERSWSVENLKKGFENDVLTAIKDIIGKLHHGMNIYKANTKQGKIVSIQPRDKQQANQTQDLI